jgi:hypothetical protein
MTWYSSGVQSICMAKREIDSMPTFDPHDANMAANTGRRMEQVCSRAARFNSEQRSPRKAERARVALWSMTLSLAQNWRCRVARVARRLLLDTSHPSNIQMQRLAPRYEAQTLSRKLSEGKAAAVLIPTWRKPLRQHQSALVQLRQRSFRNATP